MELGKIVAITCLTYILYGVTSAFQLGTFLPPIPLKPFVNLFFVLLGIGYGVYYRAHLFNYSMLLWIALYAINTTSFLEVFLPNQDVVYYENNYAVVIAFIMMFFFSLNTIVMLFVVTRNDRRYGIFFLPVIGSIVYHFLESVSLSFSVIIVGWATLVFIFDRNFAEKLPGLFRLTPILFGVGVIELIEMITLYTS